MKKTDCEVCKHGSRHLALNTNGQPIPKDWSEFTGPMPEVDSTKFWTYFVCAKNTFSITDNCNKFQKA
jgi:hypothetical protein